MCDDESDVDGNEQGGNNAVDVLFCRLSQHFLDVDIEMLLKLVSIPTRGVISEQSGADSTDEDDFGHMPISEKRRKLTSLSIG